MGEDEIDRTGLAREPEHQPAEGMARPMVGQALKKTSRFSREVVATMISLASAAFGVVAALAWNTAITTAFTNAFGGKDARTAALFVYAVVATIVGVVVIVALGRLAGRLSAEPVEFKYPVVPKT
jgi:uncharacterized membrane protein YjjP (DUF1212 family)